jgi:hypothetical protein
MSRNLRLLGSLLVLVVALAACGEEDDPENGAGTGAVTSTVSAASDASPTSNATQISTIESATPTTAATPTTTVEPTSPTIDATFTPTPEATMLPASPDANPLEYESVMSWDAKWEGLGAMVPGPDGRLYIDDHVRHLVMVFSTDGGEHPPLAYESALPEFVELRNDLAIGPGGRLYMLEQSGTARIKVYEPDGTLVNEWGGKVGFEEDSLFDARAIAVAPDGHVFTARPGLLQKFASDGEFVAAWDRAGDALLPAEVYDMEVVGDSLYVAGTGFRDQQAVVLTFDLNGNLIADPIVIGESEAADGIFPASLAVGSDGNLIIADPFRREIVVLSSSGEVLARWSLDATEQRFPIIEVAVDDGGHVYVADEARKAVYVYAPK